MILTLVGVVVAVGGITGTLAAALAALWTDPNTTLYETGTSTSSTGLDPLGFFNPTNPLSPLGPLNPLSPLGP